MKYHAAWIVALFLCAGPASAGGNKGEPAKVSFHIETEGTDNPKMIFPHGVMGKQRFFRRIPEITSKDFAAFSPFPAEDQASYGAMFQLKGTAAKRFAAVTNANQGKWLVCLAFGKIIDGVVIDAPVDDGIIVVWRNFSIKEIEQLDETLPRIAARKD